MRMWAYLAKYISLMTTRLVYSQPLVFCAAAILSLGGSGEWGIYYWSRSDQNWCSFLRARCPSVSCLIRTY